MSSSNNSSKVIIGLVVGCIVIVLIVFAVGGYYAYQLYNTGVKEINNVLQDSDKDDKTKTDKSTSSGDSKNDILFDVDSVIAYNNSTIDYRDNIITKIDELTGVINDDISALSISEAIIDLNKEITAFKVFTSLPPESEELNDLLSAYLDEADKVVAKATELVLNYDDTSKFNEVIKEYNLTVDEFNEKSRAVNDYADVLNTM
ncbi:hypothetical protein KJ855_00385 [Patescibacteria group bacterium]|nr:hypothetical protein [Patescibacteria group bacterium]